MNYLFIAVESGVNIDTIPVGLAYVAASLRETGRFVSGIVLSLYENPREALRVKMREENIDVVCMGELSANYPILRDLIAFIRQCNPNVKIIVGGGIITAEPEFIIHHLDIDYGCIGYGEDTICELASCLETKGGGGISSVKGLIYKNEDGSIVTTPRRPEPDSLDNIPFPALEMFGFGQGTGLVLPIADSRSCTHYCTFCFHPSGYRYKERGIDNIFAEIEYWKNKYDITQISLIDELFGSNKERLVEFCDRIKSYDLIFGLQLRVDVVTEDIIKTLKEAGCVSISYGIESMCQEVLDSMRKGITTAQIENALRLTRKHGIRIIGNFIFGDRVETYDMANKTLKWWFAHLHYGITLSFIRAHPGSSLYKYGVRTGKIKDRLQFLENRCPVINLSAMSDKEFAKLQRKVNVYNTLVGEPVTNVSMEEKGNNSLLFCTDCPNCDKTNCYDSAEIISGALSDMWCWCEECGSRIKTSAFTQYNYDFMTKYSNLMNYDFKGTKIVVWGATNEAMFLMGTVKKMKEAVVAVVDRSHWKFTTNFMGFTVCPPEVLLETDFTHIYWLPAIGNKASNLE